MAILNREQFNRPTQKYILVWPGTEKGKRRKSLSYNGEVVFLPARDEVFGREQHFQSAIGADGKPIPGTIVFHDRTVTDGETGETKYIINARVYLEQQQVNNRPIFDQGLMIVESPEDVPEAMRLGREKWEKGQEVADMQLLGSEVQRIDIAKKAGAVPAPPDAQRAADLRAATERQKQRNKIRENMAAQSEEELRAVLEGREVPMAVTKPTAAEIAPVSVPSTIDGSELIANAREMGLKLTAAEKASLKANRPEAIAEILKRMDDHTEKLMKEQEEKAAEAGEASNDEPDTSAFEAQAAARRRGHDPRESRVAGIGVAAE